MNPNQILALLFGLLVVVSMGCGEAFKTPLQKEKELLEKQQQEKDERWQESETLRVKNEVGLRENSYTFPFRNRARGTRNEYARTNFPAVGKLTFDWEADPVLGERYKSSAEKYWSRPSMGRNEGSVDLSFQLDLIPLDRHPGSCVLYYSVGDQKDEIRMTMNSPNSMPAIQVLYERDGKAETIECDRGANGQFHPSLDQLFGLSQSNEIQTVSLKSPTPVILSPEQKRQLNEFAEFILAVRKIDQEKSE